MAVPRPVRFHFRRWNSAVTRGSPRADNPALYFAPPVGALLVLEPKLIRIIWREPYEANRLDGNTGFLSWGSLLRQLRRRRNNRVTRRINGSTANGRDRRRAAARWSSIFVSSTIIRSPDRGKCSAGTGNGCRPHVVGSVAGDKVMLDLQDPNSGNNVKLDLVRAQGALKGTRKGEEVVYRKVE
jgi:hypothetical protein